MTMGRPNIYTMGVRQIHEIALTVADLRPTAVQRPWIYDSCITGWSLHWVDAQMCLSSQQVEKGKDMEGPNMTDPRRSDFHQGGNIAHTSKLI